MSTNRTDIEHWRAVGAQLTTSPGVHRPSTFSAFLAGTAADSSGLVVMDAGSGAGLLTIAALRSGARQVVAQDYDGAALVDTAANVERLLPPESRQRLSLWESDWSQLDLMQPDITFVNPPQRPSGLMMDVPVEQRHLHSGGGHDGLDGLRMVLRHSGAGRVRTTAADVLDLPAALHSLSPERWSAPVVIAHAEIEFDPAWRSLLPNLRGGVSVWEFSARTDLDDQREHLLAHID